MSQRFVTTTPRLPHFYYLTLRGRKMKCCLLYVVMMLISISHWSKTLNFVAVFDSQARQFRDVTYRVYSWYHSIIRTISVEVIR